MPCTSVPPVTSWENLAVKLSAIERSAVVDFGLYGGVCAQSFEKQDFSRCMEELSSVVLGFKTYFVSGMESFGRLDHYQFRMVLEKARALDIPVLIHAEDYDYVQSATTMEKREGNRPLNYYRSRPETAEMLAALAAIQLSEETGADLHVVHIGTSRVGELLQRSRVSGETEPHYLAFDLDDFQRMGSLLKCTPPLKSLGNREKLWELLAEGTIDFVASDHAPCSREEKRTGSIWTDYAGIPGCSTLLPYLFSEGFMKGRLSLQRLVQVTSENAARRYGIFHKKGSIEIGKDGDFVLIDPAGNWTVRGEEFYSKGKETPFEEIRFTGKIMKTILRGRVIYTAGEGVVGSPGGGMLLKRATERGGTIRKYRRG
jgi:dihydroorotase (multifunctional complex type)